MKRIVTLLLSCIALCSINAEVAQIQERLNRGAVAIKLSSTRVYISWRFLSTDTENTSFNIYPSLYNKPQSAADCKGYGNEGRGASDTRGRTCYI